MIEDKYWRAIINASPTPTILLNADHSSFTVIYVNQACEALTCFNEIELVGNDFRKLLGEYPDHKEAFVNSLLLASEKNVSQSLYDIGFELCIPGSAEKRLRQIDITITPVPDEDNRVVYLILTIADVTSFSRHEKFADESKRIARIGTWDIDLVNNTMTWSDITKEIFEVAPDYQPSFASYVSFFQTDQHREKLMEDILAAVEASSVFDVEFQIVSGKGNIRWLRSTGKAEIINGIRTRIYGVTQDITNAKNAEKELTDSRNQYQALVESVVGVVWEADAQTFEFTYISNNITSILGYTQEEWMSDPDFWASHIHEDDRTWAVTYCQTQTQEGQNHIFDYRMVKADGSMMWIKDLVSVVLEDGKPRLLRGVMVDITESKLLANLDNLEKTVLEQIAKKEHDLPGIMDTYMKGIEDLIPHMKCSLMQIANSRMYTLAAPSLPAEYINSIEGLPIGNHVGSCGTAAYRKEKIIVSDIATNELWTDYREIPLKYQLRACWSYPIIDSEDNVLAVFGLYYDGIKTPNDTEQEVIQRSAAILKVILESRLRARLIEEAASLIAQGQELANFGSWQWEIMDNKVQWSDVLYSIYGVDKRNHVPTYEGYLAMLHPDDKERINDTIFDALGSYEDIVFDERIIRPGGEVRYLKSWGRVIRDEKGIPQRMIGACLDVTEAKKTESKLREIAWMQSHVLRAPLARLMGLVEVLEHEQKNSGMKSDVLEHILETAHELDKVIREISDKSTNNG
jgi:PAS domain S-box